ncbi:MULTISPECIES: hypothetical protein [Vibrio]|jgi:hypothetical protein|uniref:hypothetical protein n=1 Tax=Vibrio TaxID=662 RepID=UPI000313F84D|nr:MULTISPECIES: hypothetical protein [Vibrio]ANP77850.1 hypothetical protein A134_15760 [Vibrio crassostreae 9CS106]NOH92919.1 hypothetical protein [Vibrio sp. AIC-3]OEF01466.1 hypothetical protein A136_02155 [Vibrio crassostreae 9ZC13]PMK81187.1 hypothetical protein BCT92_15445 [Vibrio sp. 10N.261.52.E5]PTO87758.1 hypothetical protein CWN98_09950 [Vibrio splendidus]
MITVITKISLLKRNSLISIALLFTALDSSHAADVYGTITANNSVVWNNAAPNSYFGSEAISPSAWTIAQEQPTAEWYPATMDNQPVNNVSFVNHSTGESFNTSLELLGVEYNLGSSASYFTSKDYGSNVGMGVANECAATNISGSSAKVGQESTLCVSRMGYTATSRIEPFKFYRPAFALPNISNDVFAAPVGSGTFTASINLSPTYFFTSQTGTMTYTRVPETLIITIDYQAAILESLTVLGDGNIEPQYDTATKRISGTTRYDVSLLGTLPTGVIMTFSPTSGDYELTNIDNSLEKIPYTITCAIGCESPDKVIVQDGVLNTASFPDSEVITVNGEGSNKVDVAYDVSFDVDGNALSSGNYQGSFNVVYEVNL